MKFSSPIPRYGILCTHPTTKQQFLRRGEGYKPEIVHGFGVNNYYIFYYRAEAAQSLKETDRADRKTWKMKIVKLEESYTVIPTK